MELLVTFGIVSAIGLVILFGKLFWDSHIDNVEELICNAYEDGFAEGLKIGTEKDLKTTAK